MRSSVLAVWTVVGCYAPHLPSGVRCDPDRPVCPGDQACVAGVCGGNAGDGPDAKPDNDDAPATARHTLAPTVAACMAAVLPDPQSCAQLHNNALFVIKTDSFGIAWSSYLRFDISEAIRAHPITAVTLELTATSTAASASDDSGSVWRTEPFLFNTLATSPPVKTGTALAPSQGPVAKSATVRWTLPVSVVDAHADNVCLEIDSGSVDPVLYWGANGTTPPKLVIDTD